MLSKILLDQLEVIERFTYSILLYKKFQQTIISKNNYLIARWGLETKKQLMPLNKHNRLQSEFLKEIKAYLSISMAIFS